jgi:hypothetical protein
VRRSVKQYYCGFQLTVVPGNERSVRLAIEGSKMHQSTPPSPVGKQKPSLNRRMEKPCEYKHYAQIPFEAWTGRRAPSSMDTHTGHCGLPVLILGIRKIKEHVGRYLTAKYNIYAAVNMIAIK